MKIFLVKGVKKFNFFKRVFFNFHKMKWKVFKALDIFRTPRPFSRVQINTLSIMNTLRINLFSWEWTSRPKYVEGLKNRFYFILWNHRVIPNFNHRRTTITIIPTTLRGHVINNISQVYKFLQRESSQRIL